MLCQSSEWGLKFSELNVGLQFKQSTSKGGLLSLSPLLSQCLLNERGFLPLQMAVNSTKFVGKSINIS